MIQNLPGERLQSILSSGGGSPFQNALPIGRLQSLIGNISTLSNLGSGTPAEIINNERILRSLSVYTKDRPWRPPQWGGDMGGRVSQDTIYMRTYMSQESEGKITNYFFDAILSADHTTKRRITTHPVQWGPAITDHSYQEPASVVLNIGMSDAMDQFSFMGAAGLESNDYQYPIDGLGKSVNAYQAFLALQESGQLVRLVTHLGVYDNMLIETILAKDDNTTTTALKCTITFIEVFLSEIRTISSSRFPAEVAKTDRKDITTDQPNEPPTSLAKKAINAGKRPDQILQGGL